MVFTKNDIITTDGKNYQCVCCDESTAIFGPMRYSKKEDSHITSYRGMFAVGNSPELIGGFTFTRPILPVSKK